MSLLQWNHYIGCQSDNRPLSKRQFWYTNTFTLVCLNILLAISNSTNLLQLPDDLLPQRNTLKNLFLVAEFTDQSFILMAVFLQMDPRYRIPSQMMSGWQTPSVLSGASSRPIFFARPILSNYISPGLNERLLTDLELVSE